VGFWDWLLRRKKQKAELSDEEAVRLALEELGRRHAYRKKKGQVRKHHIDDFREVKVREVKSETFSEDLLYLTADTYKYRRLYGNEEDKTRVELTEAQGDDAKGAANAARAAEDAKADFEQKGVKLDDHYYRVSERAQVGEIQETYEIRTRREAKGSKSQDADKKGDAPQPTEGPEAG